MNDTPKSTTFGEAIGLKEDWPTHEPEKMSILGHTKFCGTYLQAAENAFFFHDSEQPDMHLFGPVLQLTGLSAELTLKVLLMGYGKSDEEIKKYGHNTYKVYLDARGTFDEVKFIKNTKGQSEFEQLPDIVRERITKKYGGPPTKEDWNIFFQHLRLLDTIYDRPFRNRYITSGEIRYPEPYFIILGVKTLLAAMLERLGEELLPGSKQP